jgi:hypothetical protein
MKPIPGTLQEGGAMTNYWLGIRKLSLTMQPNSGLVPVPIQTRRSGWQKRIWRFATRRVPAASWRGLLTRKRLVDSSGHADRNFVFTRGREMDINETAVAEEFTK